MYRVLTICLTFGWYVHAMVAPMRKGEVTSVQQIEQGIEPSQPAYATSRVEVSQPDPSSSLVRGSERATGRLFYPIYPEYVGNEYAPLRTGYEAYPSTTALSSDSSDAYSFAEVVPSLLPFTGEILVYMAHAGANLLQFLFSILLGGAFTTLICTFTPICTIEFIGFGTIKDQVKRQVEDLARDFVTTEAVNAATILVSKALDKYVATQREKYERTKRMQTEGDR